MAKRKRRTESQAVSLDLEEEKEDNEPVSVESVAATGEDVVLVAPPVEEPPKRIEEVTPVAEPAEEPVIPEPVVEVAPLPEPVVEPKKKPEKPQKTRKPKVKASAVDETPAFWHIMRSR